jgi:hypothetical protein
MFLTDKLLEALKPLLTLKSDLAKLKVETANKELEMKRIVRDSALTNEKIKKREAQIGTTLDRLKGVGSGISTLGQGIASLATPVTKDDLEVKNLATYLLETGEKREECTKLLKDFTEIAKDQNVAMAKLLSSQARVDTCIANIAQNLSEMNALTWQQHSLEGVLDIRVRSYLKDMENRATDALRESIYTLVMAYRYEYLEDVSNDFYNFDQVVNRLGKLEYADPKLQAAPDSSKWTPVNFDALKKTDEMALRSELLEMAKKILLNRQDKGNEWPLCRLSPQQLSELRLRGRVTFNLPRDLDRGNVSDALSRLTDIKDLKITLKSKIPLLALKATFWHSGKSIIKSAKDGRYYFPSASGRRDLLGVQLHA